MMRKLLLVVTVAWPLSGVATELERAEQPCRVAALEAVKLVESGAILAEDFEGSRLDRSRWRVWQQNADRTSVRQEQGRLVLEGQELLGHNGLWGLVTAKYKDVVLVGEMDIRSQGPAPHRLALHLCGGDDARSPDHWAEINLVDLGLTARFSAMAALPVGFARNEDQFLELPHPIEQGFLCRLSLHGTTNLVELEVKAGDTWQAVCPPIELPLRTVHTEIKLHGNHGWPGPEQAAGSSSRAWFDNVRIYPRPESHHVGARLVRRDGGPIWFRENDGWPPRIIDEAGNKRSIEDLEVQLWTADGKTQVTSVRSANMGFYLLPLKDAPWDVYPVAAEIRVVLDGNPLGPPQRIECQGVHGLYPDDVYNVVVAEQVSAARVDGSEQPLAERIAGRTYPSVFQAWSPAENVTEPWSWRSLWGGSAERTAARHDLIFSMPEYFGLRWNQRYVGLATGFTSESIERGREFRQRLLELNPRVILLTEIRYRDAPTGKFGWLPPDHAWWLRDAQGTTVRGWEEGSHDCLDFHNPEFRSQVAQQMKAAVESGVVDGVMLDWWMDDPDRLALIREVREAIGDAALILVNANDRTTPQSAPFVNGYFMECTENKTPENWQRIANSLTWAEANLREPRINCLETWYHTSRADLHVMRATTTLTLTHSDGYCLFSDPNPLPTPDHLHDWYPFWDKSLGRPAEKGHTADDGSFHREFEQGTVVYNPLGNSPVTVSFARPHKSLATGQTAREHRVAEFDGDIFVQAGCFTRIRSDFVNPETGRKPRE